jgi:hypothetical protein
MTATNHPAHTHFRIYAGAPVIKPMRFWPPGNQRFYTDFRDWLREGGYSENAITLYSVATRLALGLLDKSYWMIDPDTDLDQVRNYLAEYYPSRATRATYHKGLSKLAQYLRLRTRRPQSPQSINWQTYCPAFPTWLVQDIQAYIAYRQRGWRPEDRHEWGQNEASHLTLFLRWLMKQMTITTLEDITPQWWFEYADTRLAAGINPKTLNGELRHLKHFLHFLVDQGRSVCSRMLRVERLDIGSTLPRDVPADHLCRLREQIEADATSPRADLRRMGLMDRAAFYLFWQGGVCVT